MGILTTLVSAQLLTECGHGMRSWTHGHLRIDDFPKIPTPRGVPSFLLSVPSFLLSVCRRLLHTSHPSRLSRIVRLFSSEESLVDYIKSSDYEDTRAAHDDDDWDVLEDVEDEDDDSWITSDHDGYATEDGEVSATAAGEGEGAGATENRRETWNGKVGMAIIFNKVPVEGGDQVWDYTLRFNYSYGVSQYSDQVSDVRQETKWTALAFRHFIAHFIGDFIRHFVPWAFLDGRLLT